MKKLIQPRSITESRQTYSALQKNILYEVMGLLQGYMFQDSPSIPLDKPLSVNLNIAKLAGVKNHSKVLQACKELLAKPIQYEYDSDKGTHTKITPIVYDIDHLHGSNEVIVKISPSAIPVLLYLGNGFTRYQKVVAISLRSIYSKRMYELCCSWKREGEFDWSLERFKQILNIDGKYEKPKDLRRWVLEKAKKELSSNADVWFDYQLYNSKNSRKIDRILVTISHNQVVTENHNYNVGKPAFIWRFMNHAYPNYKNDLATRICDTLIENGFLDKAYKRFQQLDEELTQGKKKKTDIIPMIKHILKEDFNIK